VLTMDDARTKLSEEVAREVREHFGERVFSTIVPRSVRLSEAPSYGQPAIAYDGASRGAKAYMWLAEEFDHRFFEAAATESGGSGPVQEAEAPPEVPEAETQAPEPVPEPTPYEPVTPDEPEPGTQETPPDRPGEGAA